MIKAITTFFLSLSLLFSPGPKNALPSPTPEVKEIVYPQILEKPIVSVKGWKKFKQINGWSIMYPPDWRLSGTHASGTNEKDLASNPNTFVDFFPKKNYLDNEGWVMIDCGGDGTTSVDMHLKSWDSLSLPRDTIKERIMFKGYEADKIIWRNIYENGKKSTWDEDIYIPLQDKKISCGIGFNTTSEGTPKTYDHIEDYKNYEIYQQMLRTFKFE
ncbi:MAG TPA: hypothetical protein VL401_00335 [Alphaproteobacteria bacterium]|jgi:hypothetical protein|nr:hypothetical protein [Alphaproteobacteria bacterium]